MERWHCFLKQMLYAAAEGKHFPCIYFHSCVVVSEVYLSFPSRLRSSPLHHIALGETVTDLDNLHVGFYFLLQHLLTIFSVVNIAVMMGDLFLWVRQNSISF